jgi:hypothetical protein
MTLTRASLSEIEVEDEEAFRHVALYADLRAVVEASNATFLVPEEGAWLGWDRALVLNLLFWEPGTSDVLSARTIAADVVMHVAWHELANQHLTSSVEAHLLGEAIASAFDVYLVGRLLAHSPDSSFLESQVMRMAEAAEEAGLERSAFEALLARMSEAPEQSFESMRQLLFDASLALVPASGPREAALVLASFDAHPFGALLHHYELATWVLRARLDAARPAPGGDDGSDARRVDSLLRQQQDAMEWLETSWVRPRVPAGA